MIALPLPARRRRWRDLRQDRSGLALMEFAFTLPIVLGMGGYGTELSFLALTNLRVSQYALNLADNASRVGIVAGAGVTQLREADLNDVLQGTRKEGELIKLTTQGRVTLSSLENVRQARDATRVERIHWQRCIGLMAGTGYDSRYGQTDAADGTTVDTATDYANEGIPKPATLPVAAPNDSGVMLVEVSFQYRPLFGTMFVDTQIIRDAQSFVVRDNRDFTRIYNPTPTAVASTCDKYTV